MRLLDLRKKHLALLIQWIFTLTPEKHPFLHVALYQAVQTELGESIWIANLKVKDGEKLISTPSIWRTIFLAWCEYNFFRPCTAQEVLNQVLWYNSNIKIGGEVAKNRQAIRQGVLMVKEITTRKGEFHTYDEICTLYPGAFTWLSYANLCAAVPSNWITILREGDIDAANYESNYQRLCQKVKVSRTVYLKLVLNTRQIAVLFEKWQQTVPTLSFKDYSDSFPRFYRMTNCTKLRDFQYRLLVKRIPTNKELKKWKIKNSSKCDFCDIEDDLLYTLFYCKHVANLWSQLLKELKEKDESLSVEIENLLISNVHTEAGNCAKTKVLICKQLMYRCKCKREHVNYHLYNKELALIKSYEYRQASQMNKLRTHHTKWGAEALETPPPRSSTKKKLESLLTIIY